jgi:lysophospholipase L1-like esterase
LSSGHGKDKTTNIAGSVLILIGLICNVWVLGRLFSPTGSIATPAFRHIIWAFDIFMATTGIFALMGMRYLKRYAFTIVTVVLMAALIEICLQAVFLVVPPDVKDSRENYYPRLPVFENIEWAEAYWKEYEESKELFFKPLITWDREEYHGRHINVDSRGVRKTWNPKHDKEKAFGTIYIFGGSTLWGFGARDEHTIPSYLSRILKDKGYNFTVFNYGESAYNIKQEIIQLSLLLQEGHKPDYVIFYDGANEVYAAYQSGEAGTLMNLASIRKKFEMKQLTPVQQIVFGIKDTIKSSSLIYMGVSRILAYFSSSEFLKASDKYQEHELRSLGNEIVEEYAKSIEFLDGLSRAYGFKYLCLWHPTIYTEHELTEEENALSEFDPRILDKTLGNLYISVDKSLSKKTIPSFFNISNALENRTEQYYIDFCHLTEKGNEVIAEKIFSIMEKECLTGKESRVTGQ